MTDTPSAAGAAEQFQVVRLDMWDYRHPTGRVFDDATAAQKCADELQRLADRIAPDPTSCYTVERTP